MARSATGQAAVLTGQEQQCGKVASCARLLEDSNQVGNCGNCTCRTTAQCKVPGASGGPANGETTEVTVIGTEARWGRRQQAEPERQWSQLIEDNIVIINELNPQPL